MNDEPLCIMGVHPDTHRPWEIATTICLTTCSFKGYAVPMYAHLVQYEDGTRHYLKIWEVGTPPEHPYMLSERRSLELYRRLSSLPTPTYTHHDSEHAEQVTP